MAKFKTNLWTLVKADKPNPKDQLLLAVTLWLRTYDRDEPTWLGLESLLNLLVEFTTELKLGLNVDELPAGRVVSSAGDIWRVDGPGKFVYVSDNWATEFDLKGCYSTEIQYGVHKRWIEWAMAHAICNLDHAGIGWKRTNTRACKTIGGMTVAEFLL